MNLYYKPQAAKDLKKLQKNERGKVIKKLEILAKNPRLGKSLKGEFKDLYSLRAWPYRIIYEISDKNIIIYTVKHRQSAYKRK